jgi:hypothetical protein
VTPRIPVFASDRHRAHAPEHEIESSRLQPPFEHPGRADVIRAALAADERLEKVAAVPKIYRRATRIGVRGVLYEKKPTRRETG